MTNANLFLSDNLFAGATNHRFLRNIIPRRCSSHGMDTKNPHLSVRALM